MGVLTLLRKGIQKQKKSLTGICILFFIISVSVVLALTVSVRSGSYVSQEMKRLGYGDFTAWVSKSQEWSGLVKELTQLDDVEKVKVQPIVFSGYKVNDTHSDNEGQMFYYDPIAYPYRILKNDFSGYQDSPHIKPGEVYISPAMQSSYQVAVGDEIHFTLSRNSEEAVFKVAGYFEDPFMGSSMIDMKGFLICPSDFDMVMQQINEVDSFQALARNGAMLHIFKAFKSPLSTQELSSKINEQTSLGAYTEFVYTDTSIYGFMMILQNIFTGFFCAFAIILLLISLIVMGHTISSAIELERRDMGILKTMGYTSTQLRLVQILQYGISSAVGLATGFIISFLAAKRVFSMTITSTGLKVPASLPILMCLLFIFGLLFLLAVFIWLRTVKIARISPIEAMNGKISHRKRTKNKPMRIPRRCLTLFLALKQLSDEKKRYMGICMVAVLLVFFTSVIGRMNAWLGPNGEGLMNAFSVAAHDIGVQPLSPDVDMKEVENKISSFEKIEQTYQLAMQSVRVNGVDYTANVLDDPSWFHILSGAPSTKPGEIVVTEFVAKDLGVTIGDRVTVSKEGQSNSYKITGIYQCANEMGANIGMTKEGFARIGDVNAYIWCHHYIFSDSTNNENIMDALEQDYKAQIDVHTNSWSGLSGIVKTLHLLITLMITVVIIFILVVVVLTGSKLLYAEQRDMAIYKIIGFPSTSIRLAFALRFGIVVMIGAIIGMALGTVLADPVITVLLKQFGIGEFHSSYGSFRRFLPPLFITLLFTGFAYLFSRRIKRIQLTILLSK